MAQLWKDRQDTTFIFNYPQDPICALGNFFSYKLNFDGKLGNMGNVLNTCQCRKLTLIGRINMVKTLEKMKNSSPKKLSADCWPTVGRQSADSRPTIGRQLDDSRTTVGRQSANCWPTVVYRLLRKSSASSRPTVGRLSAACRPHVGNLLAKCRLRTLVEYLVKALVKFKRQQLPFTAHCAHKRHVTTEAFHAHFL